MDMCRLIPILLAVVFLCGNAEGRKISLKLKGDKKESATGMVRGSFMVSSQCPDCNNGYTLHQVVFSGFDKPASSSKETFFITNNTDRTMTGVTLYIEYLTPDGRQLHKQFLRLSCNIPAGETRMSEIKSFDTQRSFHYEKSAPSRRSAPFIVRFDPISYNLKF